MSVQNKICIPQRRFPQFLFLGEWKVVRLGDIATCFSGGTPSVTNKEYYGGKIPFIRSGELNCSKTVLTLTQTGLDNSSAKMVEKGTILYALYGATSGEVGLAGVDGAINQAILAIIPHNICDKLFLYYYLSFSKSAIVNKYLQGGQGNLSGAIITNLLIPLPSINEQHAIASCISSLDAYISASKAKLEQLKAHKNSLMQKLFPSPGKTLPEYRFPEFENGKEWNERLLGDIGDTYSGLSGKNNNDFGHGDAEYITYMNVFSNPIAKSELNRSVVADSKQHQVKYGDVLFTVSSETPEEVGMSSVWLEKKSNVYLNSFCFGYRLRECFDFIFLAYYFRSPSFRKRMVVLSQGIARYNISKIKVMELTIQFPSLNEQKMVAGCLCSLDEIINTCSQKISSLEEQKRGLMQQLYPQL